MVFEQAYEVGTRIDDNNVIYRGLKFIRDGWGTIILDTGNDFYQEVNEEVYNWFAELEFEEAVRRFRVMRVKRLLEFMPDSKTLKKKYNELRAS